MKYGHYADNEIPNHKSTNYYNEQNGYKTNSYGYRCPEFSPLPDGGKNVVVLGCSHTFGEGLNEEEVWVNQLAKKTDTKILRWWNLGQPGASADLMIRILYGAEKVLFPKIIVACWPAQSRRERLLNFDKKPMHHINLASGDPLLKYENTETDQQNFLKNVFLLEKFAEKNQAKTFHCFSQDAYELDNSLNILKDYTVKNCWPEWDRHHLPDAKRKYINTPSLARDGLHYGVEHHQVFARKFYERFKSKLK
jgi:hypothetical protein